jgi:hypothetical protein
VNPRIEGPGRGALFRDHSHRPDVAAFALEEFAERDDGTDAEGVLAGEDRLRVLAGGTLRGSSRRWTQAMASRARSSTPAGLARFQAQTYSITSREGG